MRKRYRVLVLAAIVAAFVVPVGFALSLESGAATPPVRFAAPMPVTHAVVVAPVSLPIRQSVAQRVDGFDGARPLSEGAKLFAAGMVLFGLAAAVRRAA